MAASSFFFIPAEIMVFAGVQFWFAMTGVPAPET